MDLASLLVLTGLSVALLAALVALRRRSAELDALVEAEGGAPLVAATAGLPSGQSPGTARPARTEVPAPLVPDGLDDLLPAGIVRFGADGRVAAANARAAVLLGVAATRLVGRTVMEAFLDTRIEAFIDGGSGAVEVRLGDGEPRTVILRVARTAGGGTVVILEDVSELRRLQRIRSELIDNLSHELRTPLTTIGLLAETATREAASDDVPERLRDRIAKIEVETGHLVQMVAEILDLARIEGGSRIVPEDDVDLGRLAESSAERLRLFAERQGVTLVGRCGARQPDHPCRRGEARAGVRQPGPQRGQVQPRRRRGPRSPCAPSVKATASGSRSRTTGSASRRPIASASSSASTRSTGPAPVAAARAWASRSRGTSSPPTAGGSAWIPSGAWLHVLVRPAAAAARRGCRARAPCHPRRRRRTRRLTEEGTHRDGPPACGHPQHPQPCRPLG